MWAAWDEIGTSARDDSHEYVNIVSRRFIITLIQNSSQKCIYLRKKTL